MLITEDELKQFSGVTPVTGSTLPAIYIGSATQVISDYLGFDVTDADADNNQFYNANQEIFEYPDLVKFVCLEIASLMQMEENNNIGVSGNNFVESGSRTFLNVVDYSKYLNRISAYRKAGTL